MDAIISTFIRDIIICVSFFLFYFWVISSYALHDFATCEQMLELQERMKHYNAYLFVIKVDYNDDGNLKVFPYNEINMIFNKL